MAINFSKLGTTSAVDTILHPRQIFTALPAKTSKYSYPRDVQSEVWNDWFQRRDDRDVVIKMNTGSGKTLVGLLILKSCLNEGKGPALYVARDRYLVEQVIGEANQLGIPTTEDPSSVAYARNRAILVVTIKRLVNGRSLFGVGQSVIPIGSIIVDDAHACLEETEDQFSLQADGAVQEELLQLFEEDLIAQSESGFNEVKAGDRNALMAVPFWAWQKKIGEVHSVLHQARDDFPFSWPLVKEDLRLANAVFGGGIVEIAPRCVPIDVIPSFVNAKRRIFMTATLADDGVLVTHFGVDPASLSETVAPKSSSDIGDRLILLPQAVNPTLTDDDVRDMVSGIATKQNVVVIVPSMFRAKYWDDVAEQTLTASNLSNGISRLRTEHVGLTVLVNKYDGVDLPGNACRVLVLDGLPDVRGLIDKARESALSGSDRVFAERIQRIEQGMGRGTRSNDDHCVVVLMGSSLTRHLFVNDGWQRFSPATKAQLELSNQLADQLDAPSVAEFIDVMGHCLNRDQEWISVSRGVLSEVESQTDGKVHATIPHVRQAFDRGRVQQYNDAVQAMQLAVAAADDDAYRGWLKQELATYKNCLDPTEAQIIQKSALGINNRLLRPIVGIDYVKLNTPANEQADRCRKYLAARFSSPNHLIVVANDIADRLVFQPHTADSFEKAFRDLGLLLGHDAHRPEAEYGHGPDILWSVGSLEFLVIEAKNGATNSTVAKRYADQLSGSMNWFQQQYGVGATGRPVLVHPSRRMGHGATARDGTRIIEAESLALLRTAVRAFAAGLQGDGPDYSVETVSRLLVHHSLTQGLFLEQFAKSVIPK